MGGGIYLVRGNDELVEMRETPYEAEDVLQTLIARFPSLLAGDSLDGTQARRWLLIGREAALPGEQDGAGRWSVDHLFLDQDAVPTIVEVKRSSDTRIRREVVGQMLDYAANGVVYWPLERLRDMFVRQCDRDGRDPDRVIGELAGAEADVEEFWALTGDNLRAGKVRMVFVSDVWVPKTRSAESCGDLVFVDESAEAVSAVDVRRVARWSRYRAREHRWALFERSVRAMVVVMLNVRLQGAFEVASVDDQESVEAFAAKGSDETLRDRVRLGRPRRRADDSDVLAPEDLVERTRELRVAVADQEPDRCVAFIGECSDDVAGLLCRPCAGRIRGDAGDVCLARGELDEDEHVQAAQQDGVDGQEVAGDDPGRLRAQERAPTLRRAARSRLDAGPLENRPDRARRKRNFETGELAVDPPVAPRRILSCEPQHKIADGGTCGRSAGRRAPIRPTAPHEGAVPAADRLRPNEQAPPAIPRKRLRESAKHNPVGQRATRPCDLPAKHHQLVTQNQDLHILPVVRSATQNEQLHEPPEHPVDDGGDHLPIVPAATRTRSHRVLGTHTRRRLPPARRRRRRLPTLLQAPTRRLADVHAYVDDDRIVIVAIDRHTPHTNPAAALATVLPGLATVGRRRDDKPPCCDDPAEPPEMSDELRALLDGLR